MVFIDQQRRATGSLKKTCIGIIILVLCLMLSACSAESSLQKALESENYEKALQTIIDNKDDQAIKDVVLLAMDDALQAHEYGLFLGVYPGLLDLNDADYKGKAEAAMVACVGDYGAGLVEKETAKELVEKCKAAVSTASYNRFYGDIIRLDKSKAAYQEAIENESNGDYAKALEALSNVIESDTENYSSVPEAEARLVGEAWDSMIESFNTAKASNDFKQMYSLRAGLPSAVQQAKQSALEDLDEQTKQIVRDCMQSEFEVYSENGDPATMYDIIKWLPGKIVDDDQIIETTCNFLRKEIASYYNNGKAFDVRSFFDKIPTTVLVGDIADLKVETLKTFWARTFTVSKMWAEDGYLVSQYFYINFKNLADKELNRVEFDLKGYDIIGEQQYDMSGVLAGNYNLDGIDTFGCRADGPFGKGQGISGKNHYWLKTTAGVKTLKIDKLVLHYADGITLTVTDPTELSYIYPNQ